MGTLLRVKKHDEIKDAILGIIHKALIDNGVSADSVYYADVQRVTQAYPQSYVHVSYKLGRLKKHGQDRNTMKQSVMVMVSFISSKTDTERYTDACSALAMVFTRPFDVYNIIATNNFRSSNSTDRASRETLMLEFNYTFNGSSNQ